MRSTLHGGHTAMFCRVILLTSAMLTMQCASADRLSSGDMAKLDVRLRPLVLGTGGAGGGCMTSFRADGTLLYTVLIRGSAEDLRARAIPLIGTMGDVSTAALTVEQLVEAARVSTVRSLECGSINTIGAPPSPR